MDEYLTLDELCERLSFKKSYIYELTHQGIIPHIKVGRHLRFKWLKIMEWLESQEQPCVMHGGVFASKRKEQ